MPRATWTPHTKRRTPPHRPYADPRPSAPHRAAGSGQPASPLGLALPKQFQLMSKHLSLGAHRCVGPVRRFKWSSGFAGDEPGQTHTRPERCSLEFGLNLNRISCEQCVFGCINIRFDRKKTKTTSSHLHEEKNMFLLDPMTLQNVRYSVLDTAFKRAFTKKQQAP